MESKPTTVDLAEFQAEVLAWHLEHFECFPEHALMKAVGELGEMLSAALPPLKAEEAADVFIALAAYCGRLGRAVRCEADGFLVTTVALCRLVSLDLDRQLIHESGQDGAGAVPLRQVLDGLERAATHVFEGLAADIDGLGFDWQAVVARRWSVIKSRPDERVARPSADGQ